MALPSQRTKGWDLWKSPRDRVWAMALCLRLLLHSTLSINLPVPVPVTCPVLLYRDPGLGRGLGQAAQHSRVRCTEEILSSSQTLEMSGAAAFPIH